MLYLQGVVSFKAASVAGLGSCIAGMVFTAVCVVIFNNVNIRDMMIHIF